MSRQVRSDLDFLSSAHINNLPDATLPQQPATLGQLIAQARGLGWKDDVRVKSTGNVNLAAPGASIDAIALTLLDRVLLGSQTSPIENGIYQWNGAAAAMTRTVDADTFASLEAAIVAVQEGTAGIGTQWRQTQVNGVIGTNNIVWTSFQASAPSATESTSGIAEIATQAETDTGTDDQRFVTPLKLATYVGRVRKAATSAFGDGSATQFDITPQLGHASRQRVGRA